MTKLTGAAARSFLKGLPHRPPFVFVREVVSYTPGLEAECETRFEAGHSIFDGHFPDRPLVPGVILTEALAQTAGIAAASGADAETAPFFLLSAIQRMKFLKGVGPDETIILRAQKVGQVGDLLQFEVRALVNDADVANGQLVLSVASRL